MTIKIGVFFKLCSGNVSFSLIWTLYDIGNCESDHVWSNDDVIVKNESLMERCIEKIAYEMI